MELNQFITTYRDSAAPVVKVPLSTELDRKTHVLYSPCHAVRPEQAAQIAELLHIMYATMTAHRGIGLACNQIGLGLQIFMLEAAVAPDNPRYRQFADVPFRIFINPRITGASETLNSFWHGCLSCPECYYGRVATYQWIEYEALDDEMRPISGRVEGLAAIIFQHEFRHLLGGVFMDHALEFLTRDELQARVNEGLQVMIEGDTTAPLLLAGYAIGSAIR